MALATARVKLSENVPTVRSTSKTEETWDGGVEEQQSNRAEEQRSRVVQQKISGITEAEERQSRGIAERPQDGRWDTLVDTRLDRGHIAMHLVRLRGTTRESGLLGTTDDQEYIQVDTRLDTDSGGRFAMHLVRLLNVQTSGKKAILTNLEISFYLEK